MKNLLVTVEVEPAGLGRLRSLPGVAVQVAAAPQQGYSLPADLLRQQQVLLCKIPPSNLDDLAALELMQITTVGYEHLSHLRLGDRPFRVCNARGVFDTAIAEWNLAMMINLARDLRGMVRHQEHGVWARSSRFQQEIRGRVVGFWGYGGIGRETARLAKAFGMVVHVLTRFGVRPRRDAYFLPGTSDPDGLCPDRVFTEGQEEAFLGGLDFLVVAMPRTRLTEGRIGEAELRALPRTAALLNPARGAIVEEQALLRALREGWIAGAALDTHHAYPLPADHPLWRFPNVILTPHVAGADRSSAFPARMWDLFVQNVERWLSGQSLLNELTAREWTESASVERWLAG